jgi:hypothetical protein
MKQGVVGATWMALIAVALCSTPAFAQQKTARECSEEWKANKAAIHASGKTKKQFVAECRGTATAAVAPQQPAPVAPAAPPTSRTYPYTRQRETYAAPPTAPYTAPTTTPAPTGAGQFGSEYAAKAHCPSDTVVWANLNSRIYHFAGSRDYGRTKHGAFMCERDTAGFRAAKNETHP